MAQVSNSSCRTRCWTGAALAAVVAAALLHRGMGLTLWTSVLIGLIAFAGIGALLAARFCPGGQEETQAAAPTQAPEAAQEPARAPAPAAQAEPAPEAPRAAERGSPHDAGQPVSGLDAALSRARRLSVEPPLELLPAPRGGKADDLKRIRGIGPKLEALLNQTGVWHFDQIASWRARDIALVDEKMTGFHGRITRDEWVKQARAIVQARKGEG